MPAKALKGGLDEIKFQNVTPVGATTGLAVSRFDLISLDRISVPRHELVYVLAGRDP